MSEKAKPPRLKRYSILGFTMILVVIPFCLYYLFFVTSQTSYFSERNFRVLSEIGDRISSKVDNLAANLVNVAEKAKQQVEGKQTPKPVEVAKKVQRAATLVPDFKFDPVQYEQTKGPQTKRPVNAGRQVPRRVTSDNGPASNRNASPAGANTAGSAATRKEGAAPGKAPESPVTMSIRPEQGSFWLYLEYSAASNALLGNFPVKSDLNALFDPFVSRYVIDELNETKERCFDQVLVAEQETGRVIFERGPAGLSVVSLDSFLNDKGGKLELKLADQSSTMVNVQLAGADFKLFLQPIRLTVSAKADEDAQGARWVVCGLTRTAHFRDETFAVSYTVLILFVFLILLAILSWPLLKLKLMGPKDRLRRADLGVTVLSALMGTAVVTFLLLDLHTYVSLENTLDQQLEQLSGNIKNNFHEELGRALEQLEQVNKRIAALPPDEPALKDLEDSKRKLPAKAEATDGGSASFSGRSDILADYIDWESAAYPYFNNATWTDPTGRQRIKWTPRADTTAFVNVSSRQFFKDIRDGKTWKLAHGAKVFEYTFELINSKNTGENVAIIASSVADSQWVSNLDTRLISLMGTVLPVGYGYAVIDSSGRVLFHSDEVKNLEEQFFAECENDRWLRAAVLARSDRFINAKYLGKGHRLYVSPLAGTPWTLVAFRDKQIARTINLELLTLSLSLYVGFALIMIALISAIYLPRRGERISWLWPDPERARRYELLIAANVLIGIIFVAALTAKSGWFLIVCCVGFPLLATLLGTWVLRQDSQAQVPGDASGEPGSGRFLPYRTGYAIAFAGFVALVSVLPSVGFFEIARSFELRLMVKHGQVSIARAIEQRAQRIAAQYSALKIGEQTKPVADDRKRQTSPRSSGESTASPGSKEKKQEFLKRRLELSPGEYNLDVYSSFFFNTARASVSEDKLVEEPVGGVNWLLARFRPLYDQSCVESQELFGAASSDQLWSWKLDREGRIRLDKDKDGRPGEPSIALKSTIPAIVAPNTFWKWSVLIVTLTLLLFLIYTLVRFVARRFFLLDIDLPCPSTVAGSYVLLRSSMAANGNNWDGNQYIVTDLRPVKDWPAWTKDLKRKAAGAGASVVLDNFEHCMDDPAANREKLFAIEHLLQAEQRVVVVSTVDPLSFSFEPKTGASVAANNGKPEVLTSESVTTAVADPVVDNENREALIPDLPEAEIQARWTVVFTSFATVFAPDSCTPEFARDNPQFLSILKTRRPWRYVEAIGRGIVGNSKGFGGRDPAKVEEQISQVVEQARPYHQALWETCTEGQRCTLIQLAQDGMLGPKNKHLRRLVKRGLMMRDPALRLMDESFRRFVISMFREQDIDAWRQQDGSSAWQMMKAPLLLILVGVALFLFITQKDVYDSTITFMSAITAGIAALLKLLGMFQKGKGGAADSG